MSASATRDPQTRAEWQDAADAAHACEVLDAARQYGLVSGGPAVDVARCEEILERAAKHGITPAKDAVERYIAEMRGRYG